MLSRLRDDTRPLAIIARKAGENCVLFSRTVIVVVVVAAVMSLWYLWHTKRKLQSQEPSKIIAVIVVVVVVVVLLLIFSVLFFPCGIHDPKNQLRCRPRSNRS